MKRFVAFLCLVWACTPQTLQIPVAAAPTLVGGPERPIRALTDMETVHDVATAAGQTYVAASNGVWIHEVDSAPRRLEWTRGQDVRAVALLSTEGLVATTQGVFALDGSAVELPDIGQVVALHATSTHFWAGGTRGIARRPASGDWERFGDAAQVTRFFAGEGDSLWIGTVRGLWRVEGDIVEEHAEGRGLAAGYILSVVPLGGTRAFVLARDADYSYLSYFDDSRWYNYTLDGFDAFITGLGTSGGDIVLYTRTHAVRIADAANASGVGLVPLSRGERMQVLTYDGAGGVPARTEAPLVATRGPARLAAVPAGLASVDAPGWVVEPIAKVGESLHRVINSGARTFVADHHRGLVVITRSGIDGRLMTKSLVAERDLRIVSDERARTWILTDDGTLGVWSTDHFETITVPEGLTAQSIAAANSGIYVACMNADTGAVAIIRRDGDSWVPVDARVLLPNGAAAAPPLPPEAPGKPEIAVPQPGTAQPASPVRVVGAPFLGVRDDEEIWVGIRIEEGGQERNRGVAVYRPGQPAVVYHHTSATPETDGEGALRMPDDFYNIDLNEEGMAWFSTLVGAVRIGNFQSVVFGEARGVRGEVVSDVLVGPAAKVWVAAAEGPGYYFRQRFEFRMPQNVIAARPLALALSSDGAIWGAGPRGLIRYASDQWTVFGEDAGIDENAFLDIEGDASGNLWVLGTRALWLLGPEVQAPEQR